MARTMPVWGDKLAGLMLFAIGMAIVMNGWHYGLGTLREIGPGCFPVELGAILSGLGAVIAVRPPEQAADDGTELSGLPDLRGTACIVLAMASFVALAAFAGLLPAAFCCVFIAMLGDRRATLLAAGTTAAAVALCGAVLFVYVLQVPLPLLR